MRKFYLLFFVIQIIKGLSQCIIGCKECTQDLYSGISSCNQCYQGYELDKFNNICIYQGCLPNLYFQKNTTQQSDLVGSCQSICQPQFYQNSQSNTCQQMIECSSSYSTSKNILNLVIPTDFFIYQQLYYVSLQIGYLSIYDRKGVFLIKNLNYLQDDLNVLNVNGNIIALKQSQSIEIWDIINESRSLIFTSQQIQINQHTSISSWNKNQFLMIYNTTKQVAMFQIVYDMSQQLSFVSNPIQVICNQTFIQISSDFIFMGNSTNLIAYQLSFQYDDNQLNFTQSFVCSFNQQSNFISILQTPLMDAFVLVFSEQIVIVNVTKKSCSTIIQLSQIQKVKLINPGLVQNDFHLIILQQNSLINYKWMDGSQSFIKLNVSSTDKINDFDVGNFSGFSNQLFILLNQNFQMYNYNNNLEMFDQMIYTLSLNFPYQSFKKMPIFLQNQTFESQQQFEIAFFSTTSIQIISQEALNQVSLSKKIIENFNLPFPTPQNQVNQLIQVFSPSILTSCHQNGDFIFYDTSRVTRIQLIQRRNFNNQPCLQMDRFFNNQIIALTGQQVLLIDPSLQIVNNSLINLTNIIQITSNYDKLVINYNNCIQIFSIQFTSIFVQCSNDFSSNNLNIALNNDLKLVTQKYQAVFVYQLNLTDQSASLISSLIPTSNIQFISFYRIFNSDQSETLNNYIIDEIAIFIGDLTLNFYNIQLLQTCTSFNLKVKSVLQVKRVLNDNNAYFISGIDILSGLYDMIFIIKNSNKQFLVNASTYKPNIEQPFKKINGKGNTFYHFKFEFNLNFFSLLKEYEIDPNRNITYVSGHDHVYGDYATYPLNSIQSNSSTLLCRYGSQSGLIYIAKINQYRYTEISTINMLSSTDSTDQIIEIIQSAYIGVYFVRTQKKITTFNLFTNNFIEELKPTLPTNLSFTQIGLVQATFNVICWNQQQLLLVNYESQTSQKYYFNNMSQINGWLYDSTQNVFYIYGSNFQKLDPSLNALNSISLSNLANVQFISCLMTKNLIICSVSLKQFVIMNKVSKDNSQIQIIQVNGFSSQFQIFIDEQYQNIILFSSIISIYNFNGNFNTTYLLNTQFITCSIQQGFLVLQSQQFIYFIYRDTLQLRQNFISGPSGLNILKYIYIDYLQQIILYTNQYTFGQIYVYDCQTLQNTAKISGSFTINQQGYVVQMYLDPTTSTVLYLDTQGNLYNVYLYSANSVQNNYKITEIIDRNEQLVSFIFDEVTNNIFVYSTKSVYQINFSNSGYQYQAQLNEPANLFATIPISSQSFEFLFFNVDNTIFRYSQFNIIFEVVIEGEQIVDIMYSQQSDTLVIAQKSTVSFYQQYKYSKDNQQISNVFSIQEIQFNKFIISNLYLTHDKKLIHCNIKTGEIIKTIQLQPSILVTQFQSNKNQDIIFLGLSDGQVLQYNLSDQSLFYYSVSDASFNTSIITIILDESKQSQLQAFFVSNGGVLMQVNAIVKNTNFKINLNSLVSEDSSIQLVDFVVDLVFSRYIFFFEGQKKVYVWNFLTNQQESYLALTNIEGNKITLIEGQYVITSCRFQLNIYSIQQKIKLLTFIKRSFRLDLITDFQIINNNIIIIFFQLKYEVILLNNNQNNLISQKQFNYPRFLGYFYNQSNQFLKVYGLHSQGVFEDNYSLSIYNQVQTQSECSIILTNNDVQQVKQQISHVVPKQSVVNLQEGLSTQNQVNWTNLIFLEINNQQFQNVLGYISQNKISNSQYIFSPQIGSQNDLQIHNDTFSLFQQKYLQLFDYNFVFDNKDNKPIQLTLNQNTQQITWQNISITNQCIDNFNIYISNVQQVIFQSIRLQQLKLCNQSINQNSSSTLFSFQNVSKIFFYDFDISKNSFFQNAQNILFDFKQIDNIFIDGINVQNNKNITTIFSFTQIQNVTIQNSNILQNSNENENNHQVNQRRHLSQIEFLENTSIFNFFGCQFVSISRSQFVENLQISIIYSLNQFFLNSRLTTLYDDQVQLKQSKNSKIGLILMKLIAKIFPKKCYEKLQNNFSFRIFYLWRLIYRNLAIISRLKPELYQNISQLNMSKKELSRVIKKNKSSSKKRIAGLDNINTFEDKSLIGGSPFISQFSQNYSFIKHPNQTASPLNLQNSIYQTKFTIVKGFSQCSTGCNQCNKLQYEDQYQCSQCDDRYNLGYSQNICIYQQCSSNLYFQQENQQSKEGSCLSICKPLNYGDALSNSCQEMLQCSSLFSTGNNFLNPGTTTDFFIYKQNYYVAFNSGYLSVYDRNKMYLIKNLSYLDDDLNIINVDGTILALGSSQYVEIWDIINESRTKIQQSNLIQINKQTQATEYKNQYIVIFNANQSIAEFQVVYDKNNQKQFVSSSLQISQNLQFVKIIDDYLFVTNSSSLIIYSISLQIQNQLFNYSQILTCFDYANLLSVLQSPQKNLYFSVQDNTIQSINLQDNTCFTIFQQNQLQQVKIISQTNQSNDFSLIILSKNSFIFFKWMEKSFQNIILENFNFNQILDFDIGNFSGNDNQLIVLVNQALSLYDFNLDKYEFVTQNFQLQFLSQKINKIPTIENNSDLESHTPFEIAFFSQTQIQIIYRSDIQNDYLYTKVIENFNLPYLSTISQVNGLVKIDSPPILISCLQNGDFLFYDASLTTQIELISRKNFNNLICLQLDRFFDNKIVALTNQQLLLIDPSQQNVLNEVKYSTSIIQMTLNYDKIAVYYDDCIQIFSNQLISLFSQCWSEFSSNNINIVLNNNLKIITQKQQEISIYQIDLEKQSANIIQSIKSINKIVYFDFVKIFNNDQEQILNRFTIDEIFYYDIQSTFNIYNFYLNQTYVYPNLNIIQMIDTQRVINDKDIYFILGYQDLKNTIMNLICISKNNNFTYYIDITDIPYGMMNPVKIINYSGNIFYHIKLIYNLNTFSILKEFQIDISRNITYISGVDYLVDDVQNLPQAAFLNQNFNNQSLISYFGSQGGLMFIAQLEQNRYQQISSKEMLSQTDISDQILEIIQSPYIGYFFVRTSLQITSFNLFTNEFIEVLQPKYPNDLPYSQFSLVEDQYSLICWNQKQLLLVNYTQLPPQKYYYQTIHKINGWLYNSQSKQFYIYGIGFAVFDSQFNILNQNYDEYTIYLERYFEDYLNLIILYASSSLFAQIYIYDIQTLQNIGKINCDPCNQCGSVLQMYFDYSSSSVAYLDSEGNFYIYQLFLENSYLNNFKISEVFDKNENLVGFSYENITNNVLIYSTNSVYQINYSIVGYQFEEQTKEPANLFAQIPINSQIQEFLIFNNDNLIQRYSQYNICFELLLEGPQIIDIRYNSQIDVLVLALTDRILFYQQYQYSKDNNQISKSEILVTKFQTNKNQDLIFFGLSSSQVLQYDLKDLSIKYYNISSFNSLNTSVVIIFYDEQYNQIYAYFGISAGVLIQVDINQKKIIQEMNLTNLVNQDPSIQLVDFILDLTFSRYIFFFDGQKKVYVWNFSKNQQEQYLILTNNQGNKLKLIENKFIVTSCRFQLNIYSLQQQIMLLTVIKANLSNDQITDYQVINSNIIVIFYFLTYEVYLGFSYDQTNDILKIYGLHQQGIFEHNYSLSLYYKSNQNISQCSIVLSNNDIFKLIQQIQNVTPKQSILYGNYGIQTQNQVNWINLIFLQTYNDQFQNIISQTSIQNFNNKEYIFSPQNGSQNDIQINNDTFYLYQQQNLKMHNYNLIFDRSDYYIQVKLNQNLQKLVWQNITILNQQINNINILFQDIQQVTLQSIKLSQLSICNITNSQNQNISLFTFANISQVYIYDLDILSNQLSQNIANVLFNFTNINYVFIDGLNIKNLKTLKDRFDLEKSKEKSFCQNNKSVSRFSSRNTLFKNLNQSINTTKIQGSPLILPQKYLVTQPRPSIHQTLQNNQYNNSFQLNLDETQLKNTSTLQI
ncbi:hypothetical protein ABPG73_008130 [Tetrahymena malaccensis]